MSTVLAIESSAEGNVDVVVDVGVPPPPPVLVAFWTVKAALDELLPGFGSFTVDDSLTVAILVIVWPPVPLFTMAPIASVAVELGIIVPIVQMPVELA